MQVTEAESIRSRLYLCNISRAVPKADRSRQYAGGSPSIARSNCPIDSGFYLPNHERLESQDVQVVWIAIPYRELDSWRNELGCCELGCCELAEANWAAEIRADLIRVLGNRMSGFQ